MFFVCAFFGEFLIGDTRVEIDFIKSWKSTECASKKIIGTFDIGKWEAIHFEYETPVHDTVLVELFMHDIKMVGMNDLLSK